MHYLLRVSVLLLFSLLFLFSCKDDVNIVGTSDLYPTDQQKAIIEDLRSSIVPFSGASPEFDPVELTSLDHLAEGRFVGLGEATHGTAEFFIMKDRIFRYLVEEHGFKAFGFEMDFAESLIFNEWVQGGEGDIEELMVDKMIFWTWRTEEVKNLLLWMREYNEDKPSYEKIHFFGFDCQFPTYNVPQLIELVKSYDQNLSIWISGRLSEFRHVNIDFYTNASPELKQRIEADTKWVRDTILSRANEIIELESRDVYMIMEHLARTIEQTAKVLDSYTLKIQEVNYRDLYMAENAKWIDDYLGGDNKIALWAHNYHVANLDGSQSMGSFLKQDLGEEYKSIGFAFSTGGFTAFQRNLGLKSWNIDKIHQASANYLFHQLGEDQFILDLDKMAFGEFKKWLLDPQPFLSIGAIFDGTVFSYYSKTSLLEFFDLLIYFDHTKHSEILN